MGRYVVHLLSSFALLLLAALTMNWLTDPYAVFGAPGFKGINEFKPAIAANSRIFKMVGYVHQQMDALILGTSRADAGLSPKHEVFRTLKTLNLATPAQTNAETALIFQFVAEHSNLKTAVIGLDFFASNALLVNTDDFTLDNFDQDRKWKLLFSFDTLLASRDTLFQTGKPPVKPDEARENKPRKFSRRAFLASEKGYMWGGTYLPSPQCRYVFIADKFENGLHYQSNPLAELRRTVALAHQRHIRLYLFISPSHARQWEVLGTVGLWKQWEEWKRRLVRINEEEAVRAEQAPFPLWDFSGYHSLSTEALPNASDGNAAMTGYIESSHYQPFIGNLVLDRLFSLKAPGRSLPEDFGVALTPENIDRHLSNIRKAREHYRKTHLNDIAEIESLAQQVKKNNSCKGDKTTLIALEKS